MKLKTYEVVLLVPVKVLTHAYDAHKAGARAENAIRKDPKINTAGTIMVQSTKLIQEKENGQSTSKD